MSGDRLMQFVFSALFAVVSLWALCAAANCLSNGRYVLGVAMVWASAMTALMSWRELRR